MPLLLPDRLTLCCLDFYFFYATAAVPAAAATTRFRRDEAPEVVVVFRAATAQLSWGSSSRICCVRQSVLQNALSPLRTANKQNSTKAQYYLPLPSLLLLTTQLPHERRKKLVQGMMMERLPVHVDVLAIGKMSFAEIASVQEMHSWTSRCCGVTNGNLAFDRRCSQQEGIAFALLPIGLPQPR